MTPIEPAKGTNQALILSHLRKRGKITNVEARGLYSIAEPPSVIFRLRAKGWPIEKVTKLGQKTPYAEYRLAKAA